LPLAAESFCCGTATGDDVEGELHGDLRDLLARYNINDYAASVKVFAVKPS
jgi:arsenite methyltransferase